MAVEDRGPDATGEAHEVVEQPLLEAARILHPDHDVGELGLEHPRGGEEVGRTDLAQVGHHRVRALGAVHAEAAPVGLAHREDEVADPRHGEISEDLLPLGQVVELGGVLRRDDDVAVRQDHPLGASGGARGVEHHAGVVRRQCVAPCGEFRPETVLGAAPGRLQVGVGRHVRVVVFPQSARVEIDDVLEMQSLLHLQHLVHLLLVSGDDVAGAAMIQNIGDLVADGILVERHRHPARGPGRDHRPVERRAVAADDGDVVAPLQPQRQQAQRQRFDLGGRLGPGPALPDAVLLLAIGRALAEAVRVPREEGRYGRRRLRLVDQGIVLPTVDSSGLSPSSTSEDTLYAARRSAKRCGAG